jgi:transcriptional regulator with XRE-family HTH domain
MAESLNDRVRVRLKDEKVARKLSERDMAGIMGWSQSKVAQKFSGRTPITLDELEALCFALSILPSEAVRDRGLEFSAEMTPSELRLLEHFRHESDAMREAVATILRVRLKSGAVPDRHASPLPVKKLKHR